MTVNVNTFTVKDQVTIRDDVLRTIKNGLIRLGITDPQVGPNSDYYVTASALANELAVVGANAIVKADAQMPDTATGDDLVRLVTPYGLSLRSAAPAFGNIVLSSSATTTVVEGTELLDSAGLRYEVTIGGSYANGATIPVIAIDKGAATNHAVNDVLTWITAPPYAAPTALVATGGLTGGVDDEDTETLRARFYSYLQNPPADGNWAQIATLAEKSSTSVQKAFVYPAVNGPATVHVAVVGYATSTAKTRNLDATLLSGTIRPYIQGLIPEYVESVITDVTNVSTDVSIGLTLPSAPTAQPAGPGGGWVDGSPWPAISGTGSTYANVTSVTSSTEFVVSAPTAPTRNVSHICFLDPTNWTLYRALVLNYSGSGPWTLTIDTPFPNIAAALALGGTGPLIWPDCTNAQTYVDAFLESMAMMGPGEKTSNASVLARGYRHPLPVNSWPYALNATVLKTVSNSGTEVLDTSYYYRSTTTPAVPGSVANSPNILVPRHIGFYPI